MKVVKSLALTHGILDAKWADDMSLVEVSGNGERWWNSLPIEAQLRMSMGMAWEDWYMRQLPHVIPHSGEMQVDGIYMTLDGESLDTILTPLGERLVPAIHEIKLTYKSTKTVGELGTRIKGVSPNWMVETQTKGYCKGKNARLCYVHMLFVNGDYSYPLKPELRVWQIEYEQAEIDETWDRIRQHIEDARQPEE